MKSFLVVIVGLLVLAAAMSLPSSLVLVENRKGRARSWAILAVFALGALALGGFSFAAWMLAFFGVSGLGLGVGFRRSKRIETIFLTAFLASAAAMTFLALATFMGSDLQLEDLRTLVLAPRESREEVFTQRGLVSPELIQVLGQLPKELRGDISIVLGMMVYLPAVYLGVAALSIWLNMLNVIRFGGPSGPYRGVANLSAWSAPEPAVFAVVVPGLALIFARGPWLTAISGNVLILGMIPFFFQGMAVTSYTFRRFSISPAGRFLIYFFAVGLMGFMIVPAQAVIGIMDIWMDFRKKKPPAKKKSSTPEDQEGETP